MADLQHDLYMNCIKKQLEEVDMLSSIYCSPGEMHIFDPGVISDFNEFINAPNGNASVMLKAHLDYTITINVLTGDNRKEKLEVRFELPHLYPLLENASVSLHSNLLSKAKEQHFKMEIERFIGDMERNETYIFQVITWIQDRIVELIQQDNDQFDSSRLGMASDRNDDDLVDFERLWIYSHHIKSKTKRQDILKLARDLNLSGFSRPGKPGVICVEGLLNNTQDFWKNVKSMHWQKIAICKSEVKRKPYAELESLRRFQGFKEQLFCDDVENGEGLMDMGLFLKYLEMHNSGYMKKELFGLG